MIRLEELKAYQRTRVAGSDLSGDDLPWLAAPVAAADRQAAASEAEGAAADVP
jgi:hypothetical protein